MSLSIPRVDPGDIREDKALELYARVGRFIREMEPGLFSVPSQDGCRTYEVHYGVELESCSCPDNQFRNATCVHLLAVGIHHATRRRRRHVFTCSGCGFLAPLCQALVVGAEEATHTTFDEGELVCKLCARAEGVIGTSGL